MTASLLYRIAAVLLVLYAVGHTMGFRRVDPRWGIDTLVSGLRTTQFDVQGRRHSYWDFYVGFGLFVTVLLAFAAMLAWRYFFVAPIVFSVVITFCLLVAAWLSQRP